MTAGDSPEPAKLDERRSAIRRELLSVYAEVRAIMRQVEALAARVDELIAEHNAGDAGDGA